MIQNYAIVIERGNEGGFGAYAPDVPGCIAVGKTEQEVLNRIREALAFHFKALAADGEPMPAPTSTVDYVALAS